MNRYLGIVFSALAIGLVACSDSATDSSIPPQHWENMVVNIQTHPSPPTSGMSEIVVIITGPHGKPEGDLIVSLRGSESEPWIQAIEDGYIGVYRRAIDIGENRNGIVRVMIQQGKKQKILRFPIKLDVD